MRHDFEEMILNYRPDQLTRWKAGERAWLIEGQPERAIMRNQPTYHFGEAFVLHHFFLRGWLGFADYMIMPEVEPRIERHRGGREMLARIAPAERLEALRKARRCSAEGAKGIGEPDLFLYKPSGEMMFAEVKKQSDRVKENQLVCLAQIREHPGCEATIVYLREVGGRPRAARRYAIDVDGAGLVTRPAPPARA